MIKEQIQKMFAGTSPTTNIKLEAANDYTSSLPIFVSSCIILDCFLRRCESM